MATLPPPYSQRDAARAQRYYQRSLRRPSMLGPVVLIVVGVLALLVETDGLTELKNRRAFEDRLLEEWERFQRYGTPFSLLLIDVDNFKRYNDSFGHLAGDVALKMAAEILRRAKANELLLGWS